MTPSPVSSSPDQSRHDQANLTTATIREIVVFWEKRRLVYNAILLLPGLFILWKAYGLGTRAGYVSWVNVLGLGFWTVVFAALANICFTSAPYIEFVLNARGFRGTGMKIRTFVFSMGLVISGFVMFVAWITLTGVFFL